MRGKHRAELTAIYIAMALLLVALTSLGQKVVAANETVKSNDLHPKLYAGVVAETVTPDQKTIYFTFDDGPSHNTEKLLDILAEEDIKATFFVCAQCFGDVDGPALLRRILEEGHEIGLHSCTHDYKKIYRSLDDYLNDLNAVNDYIIEATGYHPNIVRFPGGSGTRNASRALMAELIKEITRRGYRYYDWDVESGDQSSDVKSASYLAEKIIKGVGDRQRAIVLLHDSPRPKTSVEAVRLVIPKLRDQGYAFDKLTASVDNTKHYS